MDVSVVVVTGVQVFTVMGWGLCAHAKMICTVCNSFMLLFSVCSSKYLPYVTQKEKNNQTLFYDLKSYKQSVLYKVINLTIQVKVTINMT